MRHIRSIFTAMVAASLVSVPAVASSGSSRPSRSADTTADPKGDTQSRLDITHARFAGSNRGEAVLTIRTHHGWRCAALANETIGGYEDGETAFLYWSFDATPSDNSSSDETGHFRCQEGKLRFVLVHHSRTFAADRPNRRTVRVRLPLGRLGLDRRGLRLRAESEVHGHYDGRVLLEEWDGTSYLAP